MPDSLQVILDSTYRARIDSVFQYVQNENKHIPNFHKENYYGWIILFLALVTSVLIIIFKDKIDSNFAKKGDKPRNFKWIAVWGAISVVFTIGFFQMGLIHSKNEWYFSHADLLLLLATIVAIIGAVWAVYARIDAEKAFNESKRTRLSFGNSFKFHSIIHDPQKINYIVDDIGKKGSTVTLYLGFPIVGWFCKDFDRVESLNFIAKLQSILQQKLLNPTGEFEDFKLHIGLFNKNKIDELLNKIYTNNSISDAHKTTIKSYITTLYEVKRVVEADNNLKQKVIFYEGIPDYGEKFRFSSVNNDKTNKHKALIWIIPDFRQEQDETEIMFESACFQTLDITIIEMLHEVFKDVEENAAEQLMTPPQDENTSQA